MSPDRIIVPAAIALGIGAGTILPVMGAMAKSRASGLTFHRPRGDGLERFTGAVVGILGIIHAIWGVAYAVLGPGPLGVTDSPPWLFWAGFVTYGGAVGFIALAQREMGRSWRIGIEQQRTALVTDGIYGYVRNPIYPLGTARMGRDPKQSVVGPDHQSHDVRDLCIVDGSGVPTSLGVNPQVTIMAMATRAAELIHERL